MISVAVNKDIKFSFGDKFFLAVEFEHCETEPDGIVFAIKPNLPNSECAMEIEGTWVYDDEKKNLVAEFEADSAKMKVLPTGDYLYDIYFRSADNIFTAMFEANFEVMEVAHDGD